VTRRPCLISAQALIGAFLLIALSAIANDPAIMYSAGVMLLVQALYQHVINKVGR